MDSDTVVCTTSGADTFGTTWRSMIAGVDAPIARAASMYGSRTTASVGPRAIRANVGAYTIPIASITLVRLGPRIAVMAIASTSAGRENSTSITRIATLSSHPPKNPAAMPVVPPIASASATASTPT